MGESVDVGFLDDIFGFVVISQDAAGDPVKSTIVPLHDGSECRVVTGECTPHKCGIVGRDADMRRRR
jgi:hypothetical protein